MGVDVLALTQEQAGALLEPGEQVLAAFQAQPRGTNVAKNAAGPGALVRAGAQGVGRRWANKSREGAQEAGLQLTSPMVLALTDRRLAVFGGETSIGSGKIKQLTGLVGSVPLDAVEAIEVKRLLVGKTVHVKMRDGEVKLEVPPGNDPKALAAEFERVRVPA